MKRTRTTSCPRASTQARLEALFAIAMLPVLVEAVSAQSTSGIAPEQAPAPALEITPPRVLSVPELVLPEGAAPSGPVEVLLAIDAEGRVTEVELVRSHGPEIDAVLLDAARSLRFAPAQSGERAIAARVRFRFDPAPVEPPPPAAALDPAGTTGEQGTTPAAPASAVKPASPQVTLEADEPKGDFAATARIDKVQPGAASRVKLRGAELTMIPGTFGEPLRVVATLPGVLRSPFGLGFFLVRGASFQNTGFFVDGFQVPLLYHLLAGPAILSSRLVDQLDFYPGGYPVSFGHFTAGIISLRTAPPPTDRVRVEFELDLLRASALAIVPIADRGSVAVAFRRSYYELLLPLVTDDIEIAYTDYQLRLDYQLARKLRLSLFYFGSRDHLATAQTTGAGATTGGSTASASYSFDQAILTLEHKTSRELTLRWSGTLGPSSIEIEQSSTGDPTFGADTSAMRLGQRAEATYAPSDFARTVLGVDETIFLYDVVGSAPSFGELPDIPSPSFTGEAIAIEDRLAELSIAPYLEQVIRPGPFEITGGLRSEHYRYGDVAPWVFDPRGVVRLTVAEGVKLKTATGLFSQPPLPFYLTRNAVNPELDPERSWQSSVGSELELPASIEIDTTLFYSHMWQLTRPTGEVQVDAMGGTVRPFFASDGRGRAYGFELLVRRKVEQGLFGWLSYTLSRSERFLEGGETVVFSFDQTHVLNLAASYTYGGFTYGIRFTLASGRPVSSLYDPDGENAIYDADEDDYDPDSRGRRTRLPTYHQLDVRIDREWTLGPVEGSVFLDILNVYNAENSEGYQYEYDFSERGRLPGIPFLPTIGVRGAL